MSSSLTLMNCFLLLAQALLYFAVMAALFRLRRRTGIGLFVCALGVMHFLENYLASVFYIALPFGVISPGSTILFSGKLVMLLLLYIREDAVTVRQPIYGLLVGNFLLVALVMILRQHEVVAVNDGRLPDMAFIDEVGLLMVWGTMLLFIDAIAIIMLYEKLGQWLGQHLLPRVMIASSLVLTFDQAGFYLALHYLYGAPVEVFLGGWVAKMGASVVFSILLVAYLHRFERMALTAEPPLNDLFQMLTYRERYESLVLKSAVDGLTGLLHRGRFEELGREATATAQKRRSHLCLLIIDIDHFKRINDQYGHAVGDKVLMLVAEVMREETDRTEQLFRVGGDEFAVLTTRPYAQAMQVAEKIRHAIAARVRYEGQPVTISIGVAQGSGNPNLPQLYMAADSCLYAAKSSGRDNVRGIEELAHGEAAAEAVRTLH
ncbi:diguanylate cyclase (GGDEF)-like protein [Rhodoligotrophos appendicifer]|uniref:GGDEF domain-containing protein n=1 Tax=Rhodoligotrophos appendicifer TaxID=987056 RepID=UPI00118471FC|nr:GGDEF domain-containing protein [Rhodoligotrophos appendicifer]